MLAWASEMDGDWWRQPTLGLKSVEHLAHSTDLNGVALEPVDQCDTESIGTVSVEELQETGGVAAEILAAVGRQRRGA